MSDEYVWVVYSNCDCEESYCYGKADIEVFVSEQTAKQAAQKRSTEYGNCTGRPDMHIEKVKISIKVRSY